jgi:predicted metalloprotease with PDZ domain
MAHLKEEEPCYVKICPPKCSNVKHWRVATMLSRHNTPIWGFGWYYANSYQDLIDCPVTIGIFEILKFKISNITHEIVISGNQDGDSARLVKDVAKICKNHIKMFKEKPPFKHYMFQVAVLPSDDSGGLEHRCSSALMIDRDDFPIVGDNSINEDYLYLLSLFSHEYFHAWNVKRIKPIEFIPYDLNIKNYTSQLWAFEGLTSYYGDLALVRSKIITIEKYLALLSHDVTKLLRTPGRKVQTVAESSFDVWIKYNEPNENSINSIVNYYLKGKLVGLIFDLSLRHGTKNKKSLDDVMRMLWTQYGKTNQGVPQGKIEELVVQLGGASLAKLTHDALYTTKELPLKKLLNQIGLNLELHTVLVKRDIVRNRLGVQAHQKSSFKQGVFGCSTFSRDGRVYVSHVIHESAASKAGISAGDEIVAIDGIRVDPYSFDKITKRLKIGQSLSIHIFRLNLIYQLHLTLTSPPKDIAEISFKKGIHPSQKSNINKWLS